MPTRRTALKALTAVPLAATLPAVAIARQQPPLALHEFIDLVRVGRSIFMPMDRVQGPPGHPEHTLSHTVLFCPFPHGDVVVYLDAYHHPIIESPMFTKCQLFCIREFSELSRQEGVAYMQERFESLRIGPWVEHQRGERPEYLGLVSTQPPPTRPAMPHDNPYDEAPNTTRPHRFWFRWFYRNGHMWPKWRWLSIPFRYELVYAWDAYENTPAYLQPEWDEWVAEHKDDETFDWPATAPKGFNDFGSDWFKDIPRKPVSA